MPVQAWLVLSRNQQSILMQAMTKLLSLCWGQASLHLSSVSGEGYTARHLEKLHTYWLC